MIISKRPPYSSTIADPDRTKAQIDKLLRQYGINEFQWTNTQLQTVLAFKAETEINGQRRTLLIKVEPPLFVSARRTWDETRGRYEKKDLPNYAQSYRLLYHWLKAKIEAIAYGLTSVEQEFLSQVVVSLPGGESRTIGEILTDPQRLARFALEDKEPQSAPTTKNESKEKEP